MNSSEAAESIVRMSLEGFEVAARITGKGAEKIAIALYTMAKDKKMTKGKTNLNNMSGSPLQIFTLDETQLKKFHEEAKKYGVLYTALIDKKHPDLDGMVDIMVREEDAPRVNRIVDRCNMAIYDTAAIKTELEKDKMEEIREQILLNSSNPNFEIKCPVCKEKLITRIARLYDLENNLVLRLVTIFLSFLLPDYLKKNKKQLGLD